MREACSKISPGNELLPKHGKRTHAPRTINKYFPKYPSFGSADPGLASPSRAAHFRSAALQTTGRPPARTKNQHNSKLCIARAYVRTKCMTSSGAFTIPRDVTSLTCPHTAGRHMPTCLQNTPIQLAFRQLSGQGGVGTSCATNRCMDIAHPCHALYFNEQFAVQWSRALFAQPVASTAILIRGTRDLSPFRMCFRCTEPSRQAKQPAVIAVGGNGQEDLRAGARAARSDALLEYTTTEAVLQTHCVRLQSR